jgi:hypothetical protein
MCNLDDFPRESEGDPNVPEGSAVITLGKDTNQSIHVRLPAICQETTWYDSTLQLNPSSSYMSISVTI